MAFAHSYICAVIMVIDIVMSYYLNLNDPVKNIKIKFLMINVGWGEAGALN